MRNHFIGALITIMLIGVASVILGITATFNANKSKNPNAKRLKKKNGNNIIILGVVIVMVFTPITLFFEQVEYSAVWMIQLLFFPISVIILVLGLVFFIIIGVSFLQQGFLERKEKIYDTESIAYGFIIFAMGLIMVCCLVLTFVYSLGGFVQSMTGSKKDYSSSAQTLNSINNYLFSIIYK